MPRRQPPMPRLWLMTDERMGEGLWAALERLPRGGGVVFRHYALPPAERAELFRKVAKISRRRGLVLVRAGDRAGRGEAGVHNRKGRGLRTASAHNLREAKLAKAGGANLIFVSPVFATRSHAGARALGRARLGLMIRGLSVPVIALGGMNAERARSLRALNIHGWAGIDAWL